MARPGARLILGIVAGATVAGWMWVRWTGEEAVVERRLEALAAEINEGTTDGAGLLARSVQLGSYFTDDVAIDLGRGTAPIRGRATVMDMVSRLQPRTSAFTLRVTDIGVVLGPDRRSAAVVLTAEFIRRGGGEDSIDARELKLEMIKADDVWRIAHLTVIEAFRQ